MKFQELMEARTYTPDELDDMRQDAMGDEQEERSSQAQKQLFSELFTPIDEVEAYMYADDIVSDMKTRGFSEQQIKPFADVVSKVGQAIDAFEEKHNNEEVHWEHEVAENATDMTDKVEAMFDAGPKNAEPAYKLVVQISDALIKGITCFSAWIDSPDASEAMRDAHF